MTKEDIAKADASLVPSFHFFLSKKSVFETSLNWILILRTAKDRDNVDLLRAGNGFTGQVPPHGQVQTLF